jgi:hypothetical protein
MPLDAFTNTALVEPDAEFLDQLNSWTRFSAVLNEFARSIGQPDFYPFVLSIDAVRKLHFVHRVISQARSAGQQYQALAPTA